jgi:serine/threonine protein kinase
LFEKILSAKFEFPSPEWDKVSETAKDFIRKLIVKNPTERMSAAECLTHTWLQVCTKRFYFLINLPCLHPPQSAGNSANLDLMGTMKEYNNLRKTAAGQFADGLGDRSGSDTEIVLSFKWEEISRRGSKPESVRE